MVSAQASPREPLESPESLGSPELLSESPERPQSLWAPDSLRESLERLRESLRSLRESPDSLAAGSGSMPTLERCVVGHETTRRRAAVSVAGAPARSAATVASHRLCARRDPSTAAGPTR